MPVCFYVFYVCALVGSTNLAITRQDLAHGQTIDSHFPLYYTLLLTLLVLAIIHVCA